MQKKIGLLLACFVLFTSICLAHSRDGTSRDIKQKNECKKDAAVVAKDQVLQDYQVANLGTNQPISLPGQDISCNPGLCSRHTLSPNNNLYRDEEWYPLLE